MPEWDSNPAIMRNRSPPSPSTNRFNNLFQVIILRINANIVQDSLLEFEKYPTIR
ncbi:MAG: hypothetical protein ACXWE7_12390 [Nitrososphaeraceae archaeon]